MKTASLIRVATHSDVSAIRECAEAAYAKYVARIGKKPAPMTADFSAAVTAGQIHAVELGDDLLGFVVFYPRRDHIHLENIAVDPRYQGSGVGRRLIGHVENTARELGLHAVELYTNVKMTENLRMYPALGYREVDRRTEDGFERVFFRKAL